MNRGKNDSLTNITDSLINYIIELLFIYNWMYFELTFTNILITY